MATDGNVNTAIGCGRRSVRIAHHPRPLFTPSATAVSSGVKTTTRTSESGPIRPAFLLPKVLPNRFQWIRTDRRPYMQIPKQTNSKCVDNQALTARFRPSPPIRSLCGSRSCAGRKPTDGRLPGKVPGSRRIFRGNGIAGGSHGVAGACALTLIVLARLISQR